MATVNRSNLSLRDVYQAVFRHKRIVLSVFLTVMTCAVLATAFGSRVYRSEGKLFVRLGRENLVLDPTATLGQGSMVAMQQSRENEITSVAELLKSRGLLEKVVDAIGPRVILANEDLAADVDSSTAGLSGGQVASSPSWYVALFNSVRTCWRHLAGTASLSDRDRAVLKLAERLSIEPVRKSNIVEISGETGSPELSQAVVAKIIEFYLQEHLRVNRVHGSHEFLTVQATQLREELSQAEGLLRDLKNSTGLVSPAGQREILVARIGRLDDELLQTNNEMIAAQSRARQLRETLAGLPKDEVTAQTAGFSNEGTDTMRSQYYALQVAEQEARAKYTADHPRFQEIVRQSEEARRILDREERVRTQTTTTQSKVFEEVRLALVQQEPVISSLRAKADKLSTELVTLRGDLRTLNENELRIARLQREVELKDTNYRRYATDLEQARIDQALETQRMSNISVAQPATLEPKPVRPRALLNLISGFAMALFSSLGLALMLESLDHSLRTPEDIERRLELPALASIPRYHMAASWRN